MTRQTNSLIQAACAALALPEGESVPEWVQLLPAVDGEIKTHDGRGPYVVRDPAAIIAASFADERDADGLLIDENHALDIAAKEGRPSPSRGRIKELEARADGIWGRVKWTVTGRALMRDQAYRGISPVILFNNETGEVHAILRAGLTNYPNLRGLTALNAEEPRNMMKIAKALGLAEDASEDAIVAKITAMMDKKPDVATQASVAAMGEIATALGLQADNTTAIVAAVKGKAAESTALVALQAQVDALTKNGKRAASEAYVDAEMAKKRAGLNATSREDYVALHMEQPDVAKKLIEAMPMLGASHAAQAPVVDAGGKLTALNAEQRQATDVLGIDPAKYLETLNAERADAKKEIV